MLRACTTKQVKVSLHEDLHPHPVNQMWVHFASSVGEPLGNVKVRVVRAVVAFFC